MKMERLNLKWVENIEGFAELLDMDQVKETGSINELYDFGVIKMKNGISKYLKAKFVWEVKKCLEENA